jgi:hypothetical protein
MNTTDIRKILTNDNVCKQFFIDVFPRDNFIEFLNRQQHHHRSTSIYVFNTHNSSQPGEHWMLFAQRCGIGYYFDSYGRPPSHYPDVSQALTILPAKPIFWNDQQLQGLTTTVCGDYCVLVALLFSRGWTFDRILARFSNYNSFEERDHAVRATIIALYNKSSISSLRTKRSDVTGRHKLHVKSAVKTMRYLSSLSIP